MVDFRQSLTHPNILSLMEISRETVSDFCSKHFILTGFYEAFESTLEEEIMRRKGTKSFFSEEALWRITLSISLALAYIHKKGAIMLEIKASNVVFLRSTTKLTNDLGFSWAGPHILRSLLTVETVNVAPEVWKLRGRSKMASKLHHAFPADIYSLGLLLLEVGLLESNQEIYAHDFVREEPLERRIVRFGERYPKMRWIVALLHEDDKRRVTASELTMVLTEGKLVGIENMSNGNKSFTGSINKGAKNNLQVRFDQQVLNPSKRESFSKFPSSKESLSDSDSSSESARGSHQEKPKKKQKQSMFQAMFGRSDPSESEGSEYESDWCGARKVSKHGKGRISFGSESARESVGILKGGDSNGAPGTSRAEEGQAEKNYKNILAESIELWNKLKEKHKKPEVPPRNLQNLAPVYSFEQNLIESRTEKVEPKRNPVESLRNPDEPKRSLVEVHQVESHSPKQAPVLIDDVKKNHGSLAKLNEKPILTPEVHLNQGVGGHWTQKHEFPAFQPLTIETKPPSFEPFILPEVYSIPLEESKTVKEVFERKPEETVHFRENDKNAKRKPPLIDTSMPGTPAELVQRPINHSNGFSSSFQFPAFDPPRIEPNEPFLNYSLAVKEEHGHHEFKEDQRIAGGHMGPNTHSEPPIHHQSHNPASLAPQNPLASFLSKIQGDQIIEGNERMLLQKLKEVFEKNGGNSERIQREEGNKKRVSIANLYIEFN